MSAKKVALSLGIVFLIGIVIVVVAANLRGGFLTRLWNWIFEDMLQIEDPPPSPFDSSLDNAPVYAMIDTNLIT